MSTSCRTCERTALTVHRSHDLFAVNSQVQAKLLRDATALIVAEGDGLPARICNDCFGKLTSFQAFCQQAIAQHVRHRDACPVKVEVADIFSDDVDAAKAVEDPVKTSSAIKTETTTALTPTAAEAAAKQEDLESHNGDDFGGDANGQSSEDNYSSASESNDSEDEDESDSEEEKKPKTIKREPRKPGRPSLGGGLAKPPGDFTCDICGDSFKTKNFMIAHMRQHSGLQGFQCNKCPLEFDKYHKLLYHRRTYHPTGKTAKVHTCDQCGQTFQKKHYLAAHEREHSGLKAFPCAECPLEFDRYHQLTQHRKIHSTGHAARAKFTCDQCGEEFLVKHLIQGHMREHQGLKPFPCAKCPLEFDMYGVLVSHQKTHQPDEPTVCVHPGCGKTFRKPHLAQGHYDRVHLPRDTVLNFICDECGKTFKAKALLESHKRSHLDTKEAPFGCEICGRRFWVKTRFDDHVLRHQNIRNFPCPICPSRLVSEMDLKQHVKNHDRSVKWPCPECPLVFNRKPTLLQHQRYKHRNVRPYVCAFCKRDFITKRAWLSHERRWHTGERPYACHLCDRAYVNKSMLTAHLKKLHDIDTRKCANPDPPPVSVIVETANMV